MSKIALAENTTKLKHWSQAIRDLESRFDILENSIIPKNHACTKDTFGLGDESYYGHVKLLDDLIFDYNKDENGQCWQVPQGLLDKILSEVGLPETDKTIELEGGRWNDIIYHDGLFVVVGSHGRIMTSTDGDTWDDVHFLSDNKDDATFAFYAVKWCGNCYVAVGSYNMFTYSTDGIYWYHPVYVGQSINSGGTKITSTDLANNIFAETDIWYGIAYDEISGIIHLCGTQGRTLCAKFSSGLSNKFDFSIETKFNLGENSSDTLYDIEAITDASGTTIITCGSNNYVLSARCNDVTNDNNKNPTINNFVWENKLQIEKKIVNSKNVINVIDDLAENPGTPTYNITWRTISIQEVNGKKAFILLGTVGMAIMSYTGLLDSWKLPLYNSTVDIFDINTMTGYNNLYVVAGDYANKNNIIRYNDNAKPVYEGYIDETTGEPSGLQEEIEQQIRENSQTTMPAIKHVSETFQNLCWYGSCFGQDKFFLVGEDNTIICCVISENNESYAISLEFYKKYIKVLEQRILELEGRVINTNLKYKLIEGDPYTYGDTSVDGDATFTIDDVKYAINGNMITDGTNSYEIVNDSFTIGNITYTISNGNVMKGVTKVGTITNTFVHTEPISYNTGTIALYRTSGKIELSFLTAPVTVYSEMIIYLESLQDTRITISGGEYENDFYMPDWGRAGFHMTLKAIFVGGRVIIQIIDNDQLADNLLDD